MNEPNDKLKGRKRVKDSFWVEVTLLILSILLVGGSSILYPSTPTFILSMALFFLILIVYIFRPRNCPNCHRKMTRIYGSSVFPEYYYCEDCNNYIKVLVKGDMWAS